MRARSPCAAMSADSWWRRFGPGSGLWCAAANESVCGRGQLVPVIGDGMRRRTLLVVLAGLAVVVGVGVVTMWPRSVRITLGNFNHLREGMTLSDIEALLRPPGDYRSGPTIAVGPF